VPPIPPVDQRPPVVGTAQPAVNVGALLQQAQRVGLRADADEKAKAVGAVARLAPVNRREHRASIALGELVEAIQSDRS